MPNDPDTVTIAVAADTRAADAALLALSRQADGFARSITGAFRAAVAGGRDFESVLKGLALRLAGIAFERAFDPLSRVIGGAIGGLFKAFGLSDGGVVARGRVTPFAKGGVLNGPAFFPLRRGMGLAGEAGPEAILPLARGADGTLGVRSEGSAAVVVNVTINTPDAESFRRSEAQVTAMLARAVGRGRRGL